MNHPLTPSQLAFHQAAKERAARKLAAARRHREPIALIATPARVERERKRRKRKSRAKVRIIPKGFQITFKRSVSQRGSEYCPHSGGSVELYVKRSMVDISLEALRCFPGITLADIQSKSRKRMITFPRQFVFYKIHIKRPDLSYPQIGRFIGVDHTSGIHFVRQMKKRMAEDCCKSAMHVWEHDMKIHKEGRRK